jgi:hypothetical protein
MCSLKNFKIDLKGLKEGSTTMNFNLDDDYFKAIEASEVSKGDVNVDLSISRTNDFFNLDFHSEGMIHVPCDICLDDMEQTHQYG